MRFYIVKTKPRKYFAGTIGGKPLYSATLDMALCLPSAGPAQRHIDRLAIKDAAIVEVEWEQDYAGRVYATSEKNAIKEPHP